MRCKIGEGFGLPMLPLFAGRVTAARNLAARVGGGGARLEQRKVWITSDRQHALTTIASSTISQAPGFRAAARDAQFESLNSIIANFFAVPVRLHVLNKPCRQLAHRFPFLGTTGVPAQRSLGGWR